LQGTDTSGKDGTIRGVFGRMSALGVRTIGWKAPNAAEQAHDYLWRIHQQVPGAGEVTLFNRSHYEDVLVPVVRRPDLACADAPALCPHQRLRADAQRNRYRDPEVHAAHQL
jgi:polyphosphate kinase 2 (PPK2 family)